jgi:threonine-phosphate decarboxylase
LEDRDFVERTRIFYGAETPRFIESLVSCGLDVLPTRTNFFLIRVRDDERTIRALLREGIVVRHTRNFIGLGGGFIRVATRTPSENARFREAADRLKRLHGEEIF